jgi:hypothetical protein
MVSDTQKQCKYFNNSKYISNCFTEEWMKKLLEITRGKTTLEGHVVINVSAVE